MRTPTNGRGRGEAWPTEPSSDLRTTSGRRVRTNSDWHPCTTGRKAALLRDTSLWGNWLLRLLLGGAFLFAGFAKMADPAKFATDVGNYRLMPHPLINLVAITLPWVEATAGFLVVAGVWLRPAAIVITALTGVFFIAIVSALARGLNFECGCFGTVGGQHIGMVHLAIDAVLLSSAGILVRRTKQAAPDTLFSEAGTQDSAPPPKASPEAS